MAVGGQRGDGVAMAHPHLRAFIEALEERVGGIEPLEVGAAILAGVGLFHPPASGVGYELRPVTDAQHRHSAHELAQICLERLWVVHRIGRPAEYDAE